jgi:hypothetical protein
LALAWIPCAACAGSTDVSTNEFIPELPKLWVRDLELRAAVGYKDNLLLSHASAERSVLVGSGADLTIARIPLDGKQINFLLSADDTRFLEGRSVDHEDLVLALAQVKIDLSPTWRVGTDLRYFYQDQVIDTSITETNLAPTLLRGHGVTVLPNARWNFTPNGWLELSGTAHRQFYQAPLDDFWEGGPKLTAAYDYGYRSELTLGYSWTLRQHDTREQVALSATNLPGTSLRFYQHEVELVWRHNWDPPRHWRTSTRLGFQVNQDNGPGFYDYRRYLAVEQLRYVTPVWEFKVQGRAAYYDFLHQRAGTGSAGFRQKVILALSLRGERKVWQDLKLFAEYEREQSLSNRTIDEYQANKTAGGVSWEF